MKIKLKSNEDLILVRGDSEVEITASINEVSGQIQTVASELDEHIKSESHMTATEKENLDSLATNIAVLSAITPENIIDWDAASSGEHTHANKSVLDGISSTKVSNWDTAYTNNHTHSNKSVLDGITATKVSNWDTAATNNHTHDNKATLDAITATSTAINSLTGSVGTMAFQNASSYSSATEVNTALSGKSATGHTHDDRYYTESELTDSSTTVVVAKAASATTAAAASSVAWNNVSGKPDSYTPSAHNQASNTITAMTSYSKASAAAAIATGDSLNTAIGKLEKALDGKQASGSYVTTSRKVSTASGLTGGGDLSADRTIGLAATGTAGTYGPTADVTGTEGTTIKVPQITTDAYGRVTSVTERTLTNKNSTYTVNNGTFTISGGGVAVASTSANASANGGVNIKAGSNITITTASSEITIAASQPTVNNGTLNLQANGTTKTTFTANQSGNSTFNITSGSSNGTISVGGVDVSVKGLNTMAYQATSSYSSATQVNTALSNKANTSDIANFFDNAKYEDSGTTKVINFYHGNTIKATIDATDFIVDGMVDDVRIENGNLVIDFNTASGKQDISIPLTDIFDPSNYYDKDDIDDLVGSGFTSSSITDVIIENELIVSNALTDLDERKLDASAYTPTDLSNYYTKSETSGATQISNALGAKVNTSDVISAITPSNSGSTNPIATKVVAENELIVSNALTDLDERKLDATEYATFSASTNDSIDDLSGQSQTIAAALNNLNENKADLSTTLSGYGITDAYTKSETSGATQISNALEGKIGKTINTTWENLKSLRDNSQLIPGQWYRITDYECTTSTPNTQSAGHMFDIIIRADAINKLNENAYAAMHSGDTYFSSCKLEAWKLRYTIDNVNWSNKAGKAALLANGASLQYIGNTEQIQGSTWYTWLNSNPGYPWSMTFYTLSQNPSSSDVVMGYAMGGFSQYSTISSITMLSDGKGTILKMTDEYNNECPYDFKNIQFKVGANSKSGTVADVFYYTFSVASGTNDATVTDYSLNGFYCYGNRIENRISESKYLLNFNIFRNTSTTDKCYSNIFENNCGNNTFGNNCYYNTFGNNCNYNTFGNNCNNNTFGNNCYYNTFGNNCNNNMFGNNCGTTISVKNTLGNSCSNNSFGNGCTNITFSKDYSQYIIIENGNQGITLTSTQTTSSSKLLRNIKICQGVNNTNITKTISHNTVNDTFQTEYKPIDSQIINI